MAGFRNYKTDNAGTTAVEFALIAGAFLALIFSIIESGRLFFAWNTFQYSVENATRLALVSEDITETEVEEFIINELRGMVVDSSRADIDVQFYTLSDINFVEVDGTYDFEIWMPLLPDNWSSITLRANSRLPRPDAAP